MTSGAKPSGGRDGKVADDGKGSRDGEQDPDGSAADTKPSRLPKFPDPSQHGQGRSCHEKQIAARGLQKTTVKEFMAGPQAAATGAKQARRLMEGAAGKEKLAVGPVQIKQRRCAKGQASQTDCGPAGRRTRPGTGRRARSGDHGLGKGGVSSR